MPTIGEIRKGRELGKKTITARFLWHACIDCGKERWVCLRLGEPKHLRCNNCASRGARSIFWRGGKVKVKQGYILIKLQPDDFFYSMVDHRGYVMEHRLVVAKALRRCLLSWEVVHHKGTKYPSGSIENRSDNRYPENLQLLSGQKYHIADSLLKRRVKQLENRVTLLEVENVALRKQLTGDVLTLIW